MSNIVEAPNFPAIEKETGQNTRDGVRSIWLMLLEEIKRRRSSITQVVGSGITGLTTDVTAIGPGVVPATIANNAVTYAKMQNVSAASQLIGRGSAAGAGDPEEIALGTGLSMSGTTLSTVGGTIASTVPIRMTTNQTLATDTGWVIPEALEIAAGVVLTIEGAARLEITGPTITELGIVRFVRKTADEAIVSNTTLHNDRELFMSVNAGEIWQFDLIAFLQSFTSSTPDIRPMWTMPTNSFIAWNTVGYDPNSTSQQGLRTISRYNVTGQANVFGMGILGSGTENASPLIQSGILFVGNFSGTLQFQWAQSTSDTNQTIVKANSLLRAIRMS
jgi:hypothetical protein